MIENLTDTQKTISIVHIDTGEQRALILNPRGCIKKIPPNFILERKWFIRNQSSVRVTDEIVKDN